MKDLSLPNPPSQRSPQELKGVDGWLLFFCIGICILSPLVSLNNLRSEWVDANVIFPHFPDYLIFMVMDTVLILGMIAFGIICGVFLWSIKPYAVKMAKIFLICNVGYQLISSLLLFTAGFPIDAAQDILLQMAGNFLRSGVYFAIWFTYLVKSKRVRNTYQPNAAATSFEAG
jgi:hypothetical protein